jgi:HEAT repeat protein
LSAVPAVIEIYEARISPSSERWATYTLGAIGGEQAFFALLRGTTNSNSQTRQNCLIALPGAHAEPELTVWALTNAFADPDAEVRLWACNRLGLVGREAYEARAKAMPALDKLLQDPNASVRVEADAVLKKVQAQ